VCHRLATLRRPGAEGIHFGFMRTDPAGFVTKRLALPGLALPRYGNACPLWAVYGAFRASGAIVRQLVEFPGGERYLMIARAIEKDVQGFGVPQRLLSVMLFCDALHADRTVYAGGLDVSGSAPAIAVGQSCRVCTRRDCGWRQEDPIIDAGMH
jgi:XRE family transcriptional regulator, fatty acid utilization regulator